MREKIIDGIKIYHKDLSKPVTEKLDASMKKPTVFSHKMDHIEYKK